jgi:hypothetical protein
VEEGASELKMFYKHMVLLFVSMLMSEFGSLAPHSRVGFAGEWFQIDRVQHTLTYAKACWGSTEPPTPSV